MIESAAVGAGEEPTASTAAAHAAAPDTYLVGLDAAEDHVCQIVDGLIGFLARVTPAGAGRTQIDRIALLEKLQAAAAGAQAAEQVAFAETQRAEQIRAGVSRRNLGRGIPEQIGFARRMSPAGAARQLSRCYALRDRLPESFTRLRAGEVSEHQASVLAIRTSHLTDSDARTLDAEVADQLTGWNIAQTERGADAVAYRLDPHGAVARRAKAAGQRRVSVRPAPDDLAYLTGLLPLEQAVACYAALTRAADTRPSGDQRSRGQIMADTLVQRITGQDAAHHIPVEVHLVLTPDTLLGGDQPAFLRDGGPVPARTARDLITGRAPDTGHAGHADADPAGPDHDSPLGRPPGVSAAERSVFARRIPASGRWHDTDPPPPEPDPTDPDYPRARAWLRRVLADPITGITASIDPRRRTFNGALRRLIAARDQHCRHPYCTAPIRHIDHRQPWRRGGPTTEDNGQGLCEQGNYVKDLPGWRTQPGPRPGDITITTPTGHAYTTRPPTAIGTPGTTIRGPC